MKKTSFSLILIFLGLHLSACSTNTQNQNTALGAILGAGAGGFLGSFIGQGTGQAVAVGVGAVTGAAVGGIVGRSMDSSDDEQMDCVLNDNPTFRATTWQNPKTGKLYTMVPTTSLIKVKDNPNCRKYRTTMIIDGNNQHEYGVACKAEDGKWLKLARHQKEQSSVTHLCEARADHAP